MNLTPDLELISRVRGNIETGVLVVLIDSASIETLLPPNSMTPVSYEVSATDGNGETFHRNTSSSSLSIANISSGIWQVTADATNGNGTIIGRGQAAVDVNAGRTSTVEVTILEIDGYGTLDLRLLWPEADAQSPSIHGLLFPPQGSAIDLSFTISAPGCASCTQADIPNGYYTLALRLLDGETVVAGVAEVARILTGQTTTGEFELSEIDTSGAGTIVDVTPDLHDPIEVTLCGQVDSLEAGGFMSVTATVPDGTDDVGYSWYVDGQYEASGPEFVLGSLGSALPEGTHRLDVTVFTADGTQAGSTSHTFEVIAAPPAQATLIWDPNSQPDLAGYKLHYGLASKDYDTVIDVGNQTTYTLTGLKARRTYYIAVTAYTTSGLESDYSNEVTFNSSP
jgi:hypothetical protein